MASRMGSAGTGHLERSPRHYGPRDAGSARFPERRSMADRLDRSPVIVLELPDWMAELVVRPTARERGRQRGIRIVEEP